MCVLRLEFPHVICLHPYASSWPLGMSSPCEPLLVETGDRAVAFSVSGALLVVSIYPLIGIAARVLTSPDAASQVVCCCA